MNENWRFADSENLSLESYKLGHTVEETGKQGILKRSMVLEDAVASIIIANNQTIKESFLDSERGIVFCSLTEAFEKHLGLVERYFGESVTQLGSEKYEALHNAYAENGTFLYLPRGMELSGPVVAHHYIASEGCVIFPKTLIIAEDNTRVELVEFYGSVYGDGSGLCIGSCKMIVGDDASISRTVVQNFNEQTTVFQLDGEALSRGSEMHMTSGEFRREICQDMRTRLS